ncbi:hypothetical protein M6B38_356345 [Iris pallida]|uniref:Uncharacterized protein n=1 Tax=Iris pallida TaxID=29817 RepID=A0AAX6GLW7_IRIPA|nr:hypothetical protein M6B38_356345 [Iris pallida]
MSYGVDPNSPILLLHGLRLEAVDGRHVGWRRQESQTHHCCLTGRCRIHGRGAEEANDRGYRLDQEDPD